ncbi:deoxyribonucleoside regulator [Clostridia bacterium]|nr:deoxyribonucleoside regulator [Clostridia bacterium]
MPRNPDNNEIDLIISVVKKYYEIGMTQDQIAQEEYISKSTVSRLIKKAAESGIVSFQIHYPSDSIQNLESEFRRYYNMDNVVIAPTFTDNYDTRLKDTCRLAAMDICKLIRPDDILGVGWGLSMEQLTEIFSQEVSIREKCAKVVMLDGSIASEVSSTQSNFIIEKLADFFSAEGYLLPVPMIVDSKEIAEILKEDSHIKYVINYGKAARIAVFSIGYASNESVLRKRGAYSEMEYENILSLGAVGDILGHCFDIKGQSVSKEIDKRIIGLDLELLKQKEHRIGIAVGEQKSKAIIGALRGGLITGLYTDSATAKEVIRLTQLSVGTSIV